MKRPASWSVDIGLEHSGDLEDNRNYGGMVKDTTVENRHGLERSHFQSSKIKPVGVILGRLQF